MAPIPSKVAPKQVELHHSPLSSKPKPNSVEIELDEKAIQHSESQREQFVKIRTDSKVAFLDVETAPSARLGLGQVGAECN